MSIHKCPHCEKIYDTDFEMEMIDDEMVCNSCWENYIDDCDRERLRMEPWSGDDNYGNPLI